ERRGRRIHEPAARGGDRARAGCRRLGKRQLMAVTTPRLTGGSARGVPLAPVRGVRIRPTAARVREALFGVIAARLPEARVLDLYAGTGALGMEALSRGSREAVFIDRERAACDAIVQS